MAIADAGKNQYLAKPYREILDQGRRLVHLNFEHLRANSEDGAQGLDHQDMIAAIEKQDAAKAEKLGHDHTRKFHDRFMNSLKANYVSGFSFD